MASTRFFAHPVSRVDVVSQDAWSQREISISMLQHKKWVGANAMYILFLFQWGHNAVAIVCCCNFPRFSLWCHFSVSGDESRQSSLSITALFFLNCIGIGFLFVSGSVHASIFTHIWELLNLPEVFMLVSLFENISTFSQYNGPFCYIALKSDFRLLQDIQLNPTLTDFLGPIMLFCYRWTSVIANQGSKWN